MGQFSRPVQSSDYLSRSVTGWWPIVHCCLLYCNNNHLLSCAHIPEGGRGAGGIIHQEKLAIIVAARNTLGFQLECKIQVALHVPQWCVLNGNPALRALNMGIQHCTTRWWNRLWYAIIRIKGHQNRTHILLSSYLFPCSFRHVVDNGFTYSAVILGVLFVYVELSHRISSLPLNMVNISRPFAAHW